MCNPVPGIDETFRWGKTQEVVKSENIGILRANTV